MIRFICEIIGTYAIETQELTKRFVLDRGFLDVISNTGILKRLLVAPASRYATVIVRSIASGVRAVVQALIIFPVAILLGVKLIPNPLYILTAFLILFLISGGFAATSIFVASIVKTRERFMGLGQALIMPLFFASNALYPIDMMPQALQYVAVLNPLTYAVDAGKRLDDQWKHKATLQLIWLQ